MVRPRHAAADEFEQNPLSNVAERVSMAAAEGLDDEGRVREALRIVIAEGGSVQDAARRCGVAPSFLKEWRDKYLAFLNEAPSLATGPLMDKGGANAEAELVRIPRAAREQFQENWHRLVEHTRATPSTFQQDPLRLFLENSWLTSWLFTDGRLDRGTAWGAAVCAAAIVLTGTFFAAGRFYRPDTAPPPLLDSIEVRLRAAAEAGQKFFTSGSLIEKQRLVNAGPRTHELMAAYYKNRALAIPDAMPGQAWPHVGVISMEFRSEALGRSMMVNVVERKGRMLVDWETSSLFQEVYFENLRRDRPAKPTPLSVKVQRADYYNFGFSAASHSAYRLSYPGLELDLFGYAPKGSEVEQTIDTMMTSISGGEQSVSAILEVKYPAVANAAPNQVEILKVLHESWVQE
jgi:transposase-like protein